MIEVVSYFWEKMRFLSQIVIGFGKKIRVLLKTYFNSWIKLFRPKNVLLNDEDPLFLISRSCFFAMKRAKKMSLQFFDMLKLRCIAIHKKKIGVTFFWLAEKILVKVCSKSYQSTWKRHILKIIFAKSCKNEVKNLSEIKIFIKMTSKWSIIEQKNRMAFCCWF